MQRSIVVRSFLQALSSHSSCVAKHFARLTVKCRKLIMRVFEKMKWDLAHSNLSQRRSTDRLFAGGRSDVRILRRVLSISVRHANSECKFFRMILIGLPIAYDLRPSAFLSSWPI